MTSKENIERLDNAIKEHLSEQCYMIWNSIKKDLEELEELKKIMGTPIQDIMKRLKILEIIKKKNVYMFRINNCINAEEYNAWVGINVDDELTEDEFNLIKGVVR